jgi:hypothetical protein
MSWSKVSPAAGGGMWQRGNFVTVAHHHRMVRFTVGTAVAEKLGWKKGDCVVVMAGEEDDKGMLRVVLDQAGYRLTFRTGRSTSPSFNTRCWTDFIGRTSSKQVRFEINPPELLVYYDGHPLNPRKGAK